MQLAQLATVSSGQPEALCQHRLNDGAFSNQTAESLRDIGYRAAGGRSIEWDNFCNSILCICGLSLKKGDRKSLAVCEGRQMPKTIDTI